MLKFVKESFKRFKRMASHGLTAVGKAQWILWAPGRHRFIAMKRKCQTKYEKSVPAHSRAPPSYEDCHFRVTICTWMEMKVNWSAMKNKEVIRALFNEDPSISSKIADTQVRLHLTKMWNCQKPELKLYPNKLQIHEDFNSLSKHNTIGVARNIWSEILIISKFVKQVVSSEFWTFHHEKLLSMGYGTSKWSLSRVKQWTTCLGSVHRTEKWIIEPYVFNNESLTGEINKRLFRYHAISKLGEYTKVTVFQLDGAPQPFPIPVRHSLDQQHSTVRGRKLSSFNGPIAHWTSLPVTTF